jgi:endonuclease III related protein
MDERFQEIYELLFAFYGPQHWWPGDSPLEIMVGAVLTQNTNWSNVCKAIENLKKVECLSFEKLTNLDEKELAALIRPSGYYNLKAKRLKNLLTMIAEQYDSSLELLVDDSLHSARENLLGVKGVGYETADCILLYVCNKPVFVVDAYTHRIFSRHLLVEEELDYLALQEYFMDNLPHDVQMMNEYHGLIVRLGKEYCKKTNPLCESCPLGVLQNVSGNYLI